jgi:ComF family protein
MWKSILIYLNDFFNLFYPSICCACGNHLYDGEECICISCRMSLPYTNDEQLLWNKTFKIFAGRARIKAASSLFYFKKKSRVQNLLHYLKYKNHEELGKSLGLMHAQMLSQSDLFKEIDMVIPVPLHPAKLKLRGYNQAALLAKGYSEGLNKLYRDDVLIRTIHTSSQTKKNRYERYENMSSVFSCTLSSEIINKNILLVDDVITTGSTIEACVEVLKIAGCANVFVVSVAIA